VRRIGLLGGMSWESSLEYYRLANEVVRERLGGLHSADCVLRSVDFAAVEELQRTGRWDQAGELLAAEAQTLQRADHARPRRARRRGVLLGCTEIDLLVGPPDSPVPVFDTTRLHVRQAVELALAS
jgi:aspartate/glutamate racemase